MGFASRRFRLRFDASSLFGDVIETKDQMLLIGKEDWAAMLRLTQAAARQALPLEACGLVLGAEKALDWVSEVALVGNLAKVGFELDPGDWAAAEKNRPISDISCARSFAFP